MDIAIEISDSQMERLLIEAAKQEIAVEDIVEKAIQEYMKGCESLAERGEKRCDCQN